MIRDLTELTLEQFHEWIQSIVNETLFESRDRLATLLTENADKVALAEEFRDFF